MMINKRKTGFTLIELIVAVAIFAVLTAYGVPKLQGFLKNNRLISHSNLLVGSLQLARSEAVKRSGQVMVCGSNNQTVCNTSNWEDGWIVFFDTGADAPGSLGSSPASSDVILRVEEGLKGGTTVRTFDFSNPQYVSFNGLGEVYSKGSFIICNDEGDTSKAKGINIGVSGLVSQATDTDSDDIVNRNDASNTNATCP